VYDVVVKSSRSLSHLLMSFLSFTASSKHDSLFHDQLQRVSTQATEIVYTCSDCVMISHGVTANCD